MLIAFTGPKGSGKDTAANYMSQYLAEHADVTHLKFADGLKNMLRTLLRMQGCPDDLVERHIEGNLKEVHTPLLMGQTPRHAMQTLGTEWGRNQMHNLFWVGITMNAVKQCSGHVIITDCRFANEAEAVREAGGIVIAVERPGVGHTGEHESETDQVRADFTIPNEYDLDALSVEVMNLFHHKLRPSLG